MRDLHPISLCNVIFKILSKVLYSRLKDVLPCLIDKAQSTFITGRHIQDNSLIAFELLHTIKKKHNRKVGDVALKIDISKAYDQVDWTYLEDIMRRMGFCDTWICWIMLCVTTVKYTFRVNSEFVGLIILGRGLRQGNPLSPYLFMIICAEGLSALLRRANRTGKLHGCKASRHGPIISHLMFTDDCILFCWGSEEEARNLKQVLDVYENLSGQAINYNKSGVFFSPNVDPVERQHIEVIFGVNQCLNTGRYLGLPSLIGRKKKEIFSHIRDRVWKKLHQWRRKKLSKVGKEILIKAAAQSIPSYCMSIFHLPMTFLDEIHRMLNAFWWGHDSNPAKGLKWTKWEDLCARKDEGGMGFHNLHLFNLAMLGKME